MESGVASRGACGAGVQASRLEDSRPGEPQTTMKSTPIVLVVALLATSIVACGGDRPAAPSPTDVEPADLLGRWTRSVEEESATDDPGVEWFRRPDSRDFAPTWFRMTYEFGGDGSCRYLWLSPVDAHEMRDGRWDFDVNDPLVVRVFDEEGEQLDGVSFRIVTLTGDLLRVRSAPPR